MWNSLVLHLQNEGRLAGPGLNRHRRLAMVDGIVDEVPQSPLQPCSIEPNLKMGDLKVDGVLHVAGHHPLAEVVQSHLLHGSWGLIAFRQQPQLFTHGRQLAKIAMDRLEGLLVLGFQHTLEQIDLETDAGLGPGQIMDDAPQQMPALLSRRIEAREEVVDAPAQPAQGGNALLGQQGQGGGQVVREVMQHVLEGPLHLALQKEHGAQQEARHQGNGAQERQEPGATGAQAIGLVEPEGCMAGGLQVNPGAPPGVFIGSAVAL